MNIMRNAFKRANYVLCLLLALSGTSCINRLNDEIKEGSILISFSFEASKAATKVTKNTTRKFLSTNQRRRCFRLIKLL